MFLANVNSCETMTSQPETKRPLTLVERVEKSLSTEELLRLFKEWDQNQILTVMKEAFSNFAASVANDNPHLNMVRSTPFDVVPDVLTGVIMSFTDASDMSSLSVVSKGISVLVGKWEKLIHTTLRVSSGHPNTVSPESGGFHAHGKCRSARSDPRLAKCMLSDMIRTTL